MARSDPMMREIQKRLKAANTRLQRLEDAYGQDSATVERYIGKLEKGPLSEFLGTSASGHDKIDIPKFKDALRSGRINIDEANEVLRNTAGIYIGSDGELHESEYNGIPTLKETEYEAAAELHLSGEDIDKFTSGLLREEFEAMNEIARNFQTEYDDTTLTGSELESNPITRQLYSENRGKKRRLTYAELYDITQEMQRLSKEMNQDMTNGQKTVNKLKNGGSKNNG